MDIGEASRYSHAYADGHAVASTTDNPIADAVRGQNTLNNPSFTIGNKCLLVEMRRP